ncbi:MAG: alpha/beta fold hydrolase [Azospirillaceae bacterium]|nr:alpha/beta fold hydrolase [Azospirillaceae bacterium]
MPFDSRLWFPGCVASRANPSAVALRLFCLPFAGGTAAVFRRWQAALPRGVEVWAAQLPGRGGRIAEPPLRSIDDIVEPLAAVVAPLIDRPYAVFGHSMGATIGFELIKRLRERGLPRPRWLMVSGRLAPHIPSHRPALHRLSDADFIAGLTNLNGTPPEILENAEMMALILPMLRADFEAIETYRSNDGRGLDCRLIAVAGQDDPEAAPGEVVAWRRYAGAGFRFEVFPGNHFFISHAFHDLMRLIIEEAGRDGSVAVAVDRQRSWAPGA